MSILVKSPQKVEFLACFKLGALPAAVNLFLPAAVPHLAAGGTAAATAGSLAAQFHHGAQYLIALGVVFVGGKEWNTGHDRGYFAEICLPQLFSEVAG